MSDSVALLLFLGSLAITALLGRTKVVGPLALIGFALGVTATAAMVFLMHGQA